MTHYCARHDPLLAAGFRRCSTCGHTAYPADAEWLTASQVLATYPEACEHLEAGTWLVLPDELGPSDEWCNAMASSTGAPCRKRARPGSMYCRHHTRQEAGR